MGGCLEKQACFSEKLNSLCEEYSLTDIWRIRNPQNKLFTRTKNSKNGFVHSRLDFWLISIGLSYLIKQILINPGNGSAHSLISIFIDQTETQTRSRGGYWKFNNSLLNDLEYVQLIKHTIENIQN